MMNKDKPRIAFCFSWQARTLDQTYIFFQKNLFDAAKEQWFDYDVFCAVEDDEDANKVILLNPTKVEKIKSCEVEKIIKKRWWTNFSENILWNKYILAHKANQSLSQYLYNYLQQLYKLSESIRLEKEYRDSKSITYEIVFRLRYDCPFLRRLNFNEIAKDVKDWTLICNESYYKSLLIDYWRINDFYFIWNSKDFDLIWKIFYEFEEGLKWNEVKHKKILHLITKIESFITKFNLNIVKFRLIPVQPISFIWKFFYNKLSAEWIYYNYFINKWLSVVTKKFSYFLLKSNLEESIFKLDKSNNYEIL